MKRHLLLVAALLTASAGHIFGLHYWIADLIAGTLVNYYSYKFADYALILFYGVSVALTAYWVVLNLSQRESVSEHKTTDEGGTGE